MVINNLCLWRRKLIERKKKKEYLQIMKRQLIQLDHIKMCSNTSNQSECL